MSNAEQPSDAFPRGTGAPAIRAFIAAGYTRFEELAGKPEAELLRLHGVGPKSIRVINEALTARGLPRIAPAE